MNAIPKKKILLLCALLCLVGSCSDRKVLPEIPSGLRGVWISEYSDPVIFLIVKRQFISMTNKEGLAFMCKSKEVVSYKSGWISQEKKVAVICDKGSTDKDQELQQSLGTIAPPDYRKNIYFAMPNEYGVINVSHTKYMSRGYAGSEDVYIWELDDFYKK